MCEIYWNDKLDCMPECEYILEVDMGSSREMINTKIVHAYYCKAADVFLDLNDDEETIERENIIRWVYFTPLKLDVLE